jgi:bacteriochlorophyll 4-vinyl reductase
MRDAGIGRVLVASLHQGIADLMPSRLEFYENWLNPDGLRHGTIGLAPLMAVFSFLRREGEPYGRVMSHAGTCAADWLLSSRRLPLGPLARRLPAGLRTRVALGTACRLVRACYRGNRAAVRGHAGGRWLEIRDSVFCTAREPAATPLCGFYVALTARVLQAYGLDCAVQASACRATGFHACELAVSLASQPDATSATAGHEAAS